MADPKTKRVEPKILQADADTITALETITTYKPANDTYTLTKAQAAVALRVGTAAAEVKAEAAFKAARDQAVAAEQALHAMALGVRDQVIAQFGQSSDEVQTIGLKKKSERKAPVPRQAKPTA